MQLKKFRVQKFRSIEDSGWIDTTDNTCFVGTNESGKTNILLALWKLNPANDEPINLLSDYPRNKYASNKTLAVSEIFIEATFEAGEKALEWSKKLGCDQADIEEINISRNFGGVRQVKFPMNIQSNEKILHEVENEIFKYLPKFVYYSDYGNLDSEIYLPHTVQNISRLKSKEQIGEKEKAKARTIKVLFEFLNLNPQEILVMGQETNRIDEDKEKKRERQILMDSAAGELTKKFKAWWKQGEYIFNFQADGSFFRIWVSDSKRPEKVELEGRSRGLQWFFSFFLVFLVESGDSHNNCILLLDEPGVSLHPIAQKDLVAFFEALSKDNQLLYTTHSPFLVNAGNLASAKVVYVDENGYSAVSNDLRKNSAVANSSIYPINAAIGINVSDSLLIGCQPVLVEGISDVFYLNAIKNFLLNKGLYKNDKELVFIPTGGVKGVSPVASVVASKNEGLPFAIIDSDKQGKDKYNTLKNGLYKECSSKLLLVDSFLMPQALAWEIEDLIPSATLANLFSKMFKASEYNTDFDEVCDTTLPILPQMEQFAQANNHILNLGWKVELAKRVQTFLQNPKNESKINEASVKMWETLFNTITSK